MIPEPMLVKFIESSSYRYDLAIRSQNRLSEPELTKFISIIRRQAIARRSSVEITDGTSRRFAIIAYLRGIEPIAAEELSRWILKDVLISGSHQDRLEVVGMLRFPSVQPKREPYLCWTKEEYDDFVVACHRIDRETKAVLHEARQAIEELRMKRADAEYAVSELNRLANQLAEKPDALVLYSIWQHIKEVAPTIASILSAIASIAKILA